MSFLLKYAVSYCKHLNEIVFVGIRLSTQLILYIASQDPLRMQ